MTKVDSTAILDDLSVLVIEERDALLTGQLDALSDILDRKETLIGSLASRQPNDRSKLESLQASMDRNKALFDHALEGVRTVASRLGALRRLRRSLDTYDSLGRKTEIAEPLSKRLERRA